MKKLVLACSVLFILIFGACSKDSGISQSTANAGNSGQGGSLARFTIVKNHLYTIDHQDLSVFDITNANKPIFIRKVNIGFNIEALFPYQDKLFIASNNAMYIYNITDPTRPFQESRVQHFTGCDPVVVNDTIAFLTIHGGNACGSSINQLNVYDISQINSPNLMTSIPMTNPHGLGLKDSILYICDRGKGLRVLNVKEPSNPVEIDILTGDTYLDVIPTGNLLIGMLTNGIAYLDISNPASPQKLAHIKK